MSTIDARAEDVMNILLATDIHMGYNEKDKIRGEDSFNTFEEILCLAVAKEVDFILLGGDLFHDSKPSMACIYKAMSLIKKYCLGDKPVAIQFLSDQSQNFKHCVSPIVNYEDPNMNISTPIFSIHGNHDDPSGFGSTCTLDLLSATGLVNYFGRVDDLSEIKISPLLMKKGETQLAIYGLSYIKDDRLARLFRDKKVHMYTESGAHPDDWFNIFVCHQNRADRGFNKFLSEDVLPNFLDIVFWGHEHDCRIVGEKNTNKKFFVTQPGSSVATSLSEGEAIPKHVGLLRVHKKHFKLEPIPLQTVRPFVFDSIVLSKCSLPDDGESPADDVVAYVTDYLDSLFDQVHPLLTGHPKQPTLPLIRLRVDYNEENQMFNAIRFSQSLSDRVANPTDVILLRREAREKKVKAEGVIDRDALNAILDTEDLLQPQSMWDLQVSKVIELYFEQENNEKYRLQVLSVNGMCEAVKQFIQKDDKDAVDEVVKNQMAKASTYLKDHGVTDDNKDTLLQTFRQLRAANPEEEVTEARAALAKPNRRNVPSLEDDVDIQVDSEDEFRGTTGPVAAPTRGQSRGRRRAAARTTPATRRGRGRASTTNIQPSVADAFTSFVSTRTPRASRATSYVQTISDSD